MIYFVFLSFSNFISVSSFFWITLLRSFPELSINCFKYLLYVLQTLYFICSLTKWKSTHFNEHWTMAQYSCVSFRLIRFDYGWAPRAYFFSLSIVLSFTSCEMEFVKRCRCWWLMLKLYTTISRTQYTTNIYLLHHFTTKHIQLAHFFRTFLRHDSLFDSGTWVPQRKYWMPAQFIILSLNWCYCCC